MPAERLIFLASMFDHGELRAVRAQALFAADQSC